jgi:hypothetical protein
MMEDSEIAFCSYDPPFAYTDEDAYQLYCADECKPGAGVWLAVLACPLWLGAGLQQMILLLRIHHDQVGNEAEEDISNIHEEPAKEE